MPATTADLSDVTTEEEREVEAIRWLLAALPAATPEERAAFLATADLPTYEVAEHYRPHVETDRADRLAAWDEAEDWGDAA